MYKELDRFCNEHYIVKEKDGNIVIFELDVYGNETFLEDTEIATQYLTKEDLERVQEGITIYTKKELNKTIEDFE